MLASLSSGSRVPARVAGSPSRARCRGRRGSRDPSLYQEGLAKRLAKLGAASPSPSVTHRLSVEGDQRDGYEQQDGLIKRPRNRQEAERCEPSKWLWDATVAGEQLDSADCPGNRSVCAPHTASLGGECNGSRSGKRARQLGEDGQVGMKPNPIQPSRTRRGAAPTRASSGRTRARQRRGCGRACASAASRAG